MEHARVSTPRVAVSWTQKPASRDDVISALGGKLVSGSGGVTHNVQLDKLPPQAQRLIKAGLGMAPEPPAFPMDDISHVVPCTVIPPNYTPGTEGPEYAVTEPTKETYVNYLNRQNVPVLLTHEFGTHDRFGHIINASLDTKTGHLKGEMALRKGNSKTGRMSGMHHVKNGFLSASLSAFQLGTAELDRPIDVSLCKNPARKGSHVYILESRRVNASNGGGVTEVRRRAGEVAVMNLVLDVEKARPFDPTTDVPTPQGIHMSIICGP